MSLIKQTKIISLSSNDGIIQHNQSAGYLSDLKFDFKQVLGDDKNIAYSTIALHSVDMTNSFYNVNELNNKIDVKITIVTSGNETNSTITIPIIIKFNALLLAGTGKAGILALDRNNGLYSLTPDANTYKIKLLPSSTAYGVLGITANTTPEFIFGNPNVFNLDSKSLTQNNLIAVIPVVAPSYALITYDNRNEESLLRNKDIGEIDLLITDNTGTLANFNFIDWSITLTINTYRIIEIDKILSAIDFKDLLNIKREIKTKEIKKEKKPLPKPDKDLQLLMS